MPGNPRDIADLCHLISIEPDKSESARTFLQDENRLKDPNARKQFHIDAPN